MDKLDFLSKVKHFEGLRLKAYKCSSGVLTIGYGHTYGVLPNMSISFATADYFLSFDIFIVEEQLICVHPNFDSFPKGLRYALIDFVFNVGISKYMCSTLRNVVESVSQSGKFDDSSRQRISVELQKWCFAKGKKLHGLEKRRNWECELLYLD